MNQISLALIRRVLREIATEIRGEKQCQIRVEHPLGISENHKKFKKILADY